MVVRVLRWSSWTMGVACTVIGAVHFVLGIASVPGEQAAGATVDSRERFYAAVFAGYGLGWVWAARRSPIPPQLIRWLTALFLVGGVGRALSVAVHGWPHRFQVVLMFVELGVPVGFFWLADADVRNRAGRPAPLGHRCDDW